MGRLDLHLILGWYPNQNPIPSYVSECVIRAGGKNRRAAEVRLGRTTRLTCRRRKAKTSIPFQGVTGKASSGLRLSLFAAKFQQVVLLVLSLLFSATSEWSCVSSLRITTESYFADQ